MMTSELASNQPRSQLLIVDDSGQNRLLLRNMLEQEGFSVAEASTGQACLEFCKRQEPTMVLLDMMMPELGGIDVCRMLRADFSRHMLPVIMVTTKSEHSGIKESLIAGANDYVIKPVDRQILLARINNQLEMQFAYQQIQNQHRIIARHLKIQHALGDSLPEAILITNSVGEVLYCNPQARQFCGADPSSFNELTKLIFGGAIESQLRQCWDEFIRIPGLERRVEYDLARGGIKNIYQFSRPVMAGEDGLRLWVWQDRTKTVSLEQRIAQQVTLETVSVFAAGVAHNFNNILSSIVGAAGLISKDLGDAARIKRCAGIIENATLSGQKLIKKMSTLIRREVNLIPDQESSLRQIVESICQVQEALTMDQVSFVIEIPEDLPPLGMHSSNVTDVCANLISNAVDAVALAGEVRVTANCAGPQGQVVLIVADNGRGIEAEHLPRIFEPFYTTKNIDKYNGVGIEGNGLGLWNVISLLRSSGGGIKVTSEVKVGTEVEVIFPVRAAGSD